MKTALGRLIVLAMFCPALLSVAQAEDPLVLAPANTILLKGLTLDFHAQIGVAGHVLTAQIQSWSSSNSGVASIDASGHLAALSINPTKGH